MSRRLDTTTATSSDATTLVHVSVDQRTIVLVDAQALSDRVAAESLYLALFGKSLRVR